MKEQFARRHIPPDPGYCSPGGASPLQAETPTLTTDWVAGPGSRVADLPQHVWLNDGTAILDDGVFERLDPVTAKRRPVLDMNRAVASLKSIDPAIDVHGKLSWPIAFNL
jgi:hypothetical protein